MHPASRVAERAPWLRRPQVTGVFARRGYNIQSLAVGPSEREGVSRICMMVPGTQVGRGGGGWDHCTSKVLPRAAWLRSALACSPLSTCLCALVFLHGHRARPACLQPAIDKLLSQLSKLVFVESVCDLTSQPFVNLELALIKVRAAARQHPTLVATPPMQPCAPRPRHRCQCRSSAA